MSDDHHLPARRQALPIFIGLIVSAALAVVAVRCSSRDAMPPSALNAEQTQGSEAEAAPIADQPPAAQVAEEQAAQKQQNAAPDAGSTSVGKLMQVTDAHDRTLLADIERKAEQTPDKSVYQLLELRRAGKPRAELERFIQNDLKGGVAVKLSAMKWLRAIHGEPDPEPPSELLRGPGEPDPQDRVVKPLTKVGPQE